MNNFRRRIACILAVSFLVITCKAYSQTSDPKQQAVIVKHLGIMDSIYTKIITKYVESVDPAQLMRKGIDGMLASLDPFTKYQSKEDADEFNARLEGRFGGIGVYLMQVDSEIVVGAVYEGFPADQAGMKVGDIIISIDDILTHGRDAGEMSSLLHGLPGEHVKLVIRHTGQKKTETLDISRDEINLSSVPYYGMLTKDLGYIRFTGFTKDCNKEIKAALINLESEHALKGLVLDLRNNPGGLVEEAIRISNLFLEKGSTIVRTHGRNEDTTIYATDQAVDTKLPLILLTNDYTQSSAEVLAGALQDNDRAIVVGQKTFGKGLVGVLYGMNDGSQLILTVEHYYTPAGRCIQARNYPGSGGGGERIADSLKKEYKTRNGRIVRDADGITPDIVMDPRNNPVVVNSLLESDLLFRFARSYKLKHPSIPSPEAFHITENDYARFLSDLQAAKFTYETGSQDKLREMKEVAIADGYGQALEPALIKLELQLKQEKQKDLIRYKQNIKELLEEEIAAHYYYEKGRIQASLKDDPELKKAIGILNDPIRYRKLLNVN